jgi:hypothetical protein
MAINWKPISSDKLFGRIPPAPSPAPTPVLTTTPINTDLREPRGSYVPGSRKIKDYTTESEAAMKKGGLIKKKTITKKKKK